MLKKLSIVHFEHLNKYEFDNTQTLVERINETRQLFPKHCSAVTYIYPKDDTYIKNHQSELSNIIGQLPTSLQIQWIYTLFRYLRRRKCDISWLFDLFSANLSASPGTEYKHKKKKIFRYFLAINRKGLLCVDKIQRVIEIVLKKTLYKKQKILHDILNVQEISPSILKIAVQNLSGLNTKYSHDIFYRFSPQGRIIKKIRIRFKTLENHMDKNFFLAFVLSLLPHIINYRYGKKIVRKIFVHWGQQ